MNLAADAPLLLAFAALPDPRKSRNQIYPLIDIIAVAIIGILCSGNDWVHVEPLAKFLTKRRSF